ncbi:hypothetical protein BH24BAC1_BH24BAC1_25700 [soil metagenome]
MTLILLRDIGLQLPLRNPVLIFSLILFIVLFAPLLLNKLRIPQLIGLIIAGAVIGPNGFNLLLRDSSVVLFGTVGMLYIMFLAGLEIDLADFKKNRNKSLAFGMYTFLIPMGLGILAGYYLLAFSLPTSVLLASMFASHTLIAYPLVSKVGIAKSRSVNVTVGGTMITDTLALLVLAVIAGMATGEINNEFWIRLSISIVVFGLIVTLLFPLLGRWFFKKFDDNVSQYIFVLALVFLAAFLAEAAGIEAIIGAFLAGLALNRLIPHTSPLMNRIEFVEFSDWDDFLIISRDLKPNDALIVVLSRPSGLSYNRAMDRVSRHLNKYFNQNNFILIYPIQTAANGDGMASLAGETSAGAAPAGRRDVRGLIGRLFGHK